MTVVSPATRYARSSGSADLRGGLTLADEHMLLLGQVTARAGELLDTAARGRWPAAELAALAGYVRAEVLRQTADEEMLLFPAGPSLAATRLARDHARLRAGAERLERAAAGQRPVDPTQLAAAARDFAAQLEHHMTAEEHMLAAERAPHSVPATVALGRHPHDWYPLTEGPVIDLDALPPSEAVAAAADRLLRLARGEQVELESSTELGPVWREINELMPGGYGFVSLQDGPHRWRMRVARRLPET